MLHRVAMLVRACDSAGWPMSKRVSDSLASVGFGKKIFRDSPKVHIVRHLMYALVCYLCPRTQYSLQSPRPQTAPHHLQTASAALAFLANASPAADSTTSSPALPLSSPTSPPGVILQSHSELASPDDSNIRPFESTTCGEVYVSASAAIVERAKGLHTRRPEAHLVSPTSLSLSPSRSSKLGHDAFQSSPRPCQAQSSSVENSPRASTSPTSMQSIASTHESNAATESASRTVSNGEIYHGMWSAVVRSGFGRTQHADGVV